MNEVNTAENKVCAIGSVAAAIALLFGGTFLIALLIVIVAVILGVDTQLFAFVHSIPDIPSWIRWPMDAIALIGLSAWLYPKCMRARLKRRLSHV